MADAIKNFAYSTITTAPSSPTAGTSCVVASGAVFPTAPFNAVVWPPGVIPLSTNAEIVRVTVVSTNTLTITRAQEGTSAQSVAIGWQIDAGITVALFEQYAPSSVASARAFVSSTSQTLATATTAAITSMTADTTYGNTGITVTGTGFTIITPGKYRICGAVEAQFGTGPTPGNGAQFSLTKNGTAFCTTGSAIWFFLAEFWTGFASDVVVCANGDTIGMSVDNLTGQTMTFQAGTALMFLSAVLEAV